MFGLFRPVCPIHPADKAWVDLRMGWLVRALGRERLLESPVILPTAEFFPEPYERSDDDIGRVYRQVCGFVKIDPNRLTLDFFDASDRQREHAAGIYEQGPPERILVNRGELELPASLIATLAHELSHALLLGDGRLSYDAFDMEHMTDLCTVYLGLGVFGANSAAREWHGHGVGLKGYLSEIIYAYALALYAWSRGEHNPAWAAHLRLNVREPFWASLKYLRKTGDTLLAIDEAKDPPRLPAGELVASLLADLKSESAGKQIAALWRIEELAGANQHLPGFRAAPFPPELIEPVAQMLSRGEPSVRERAIYTLGVIGPPAVSVIPALVEVLESRQEPLRKSALWTLGRIGDLTPAQADDVAALVEDPAREVRLEAARTVKLLGPKAKTAVRRLMRALREWDPYDRGVAAEALGAIGPAAAPALPLLLSAVTDIDDVSNVAVAGALGALVLAGCVGYTDDVEAPLGPDDLAQSLILALGVRNEELRAAAAAALGGLGPAAEEALPILAMLAEGEGEAQLSAAMALKQIQGVAGPLLAALRAVAPHWSAENGMTEAAVNESEWNRAVAVLDAQDTGEIAPLLASTAANDRWFAALALAELGPRAASACGALAAVLQDPIVRVRLAAAFAIFNAAGTIEPLLAALANVVENPGEDARFTYVIEMALLEIGPPAVAPLLNLAAHGPEKTAGAAARLVARLAVLDPQARHLVDELSRQVSPESRQLAGRIAELRASEERAIRAEHFRSDSLAPRLPAEPSPLPIWRALGWLRMGDEDLARSLPREPNHVRG